MNRYPLWKYAVILVALVFGLLFAIPNFFGVAPAIQISAAKSTVKVTPDMQGRIESTLAAQNIANTGIYYTKTGTSGSFHIRLPKVNEAEDKAVQSKAQAALKAAFNTNTEEPDYTVAINSISNSPDWLSAIGAKPMSLGLDLRGGVHFLLQVDMDGAVQKRLDGLQNELTIALKEQNITVQNSEKTGQQLTLMFGSTEIANTARSEIAHKHTNLKVETSGNNVNISLTDAELIDVKANALKQNITTLHNRVNELGVSEPVVQQQGSDRIVVELPGVSDIAQAKELIGRTATLQVRLAETGTGFNNEKFKYGTGEAAVKKQVIVSGDSIINAQAAFDENNNPNVSLTLDSAGGKIMRQTTHDNIKKPMAIILFEKGKGEIISLATIQGEFGENFQITGAGSIEDANNLAILLRAGSLAAPMEIINERMIGPSLGEENIKKGLDSLLYGFIAIAVFIILYYRMFGVFSVIALAMNLLFLVALLSLIGATMTLPGIAAIALTLGMAIDSNVLINERIREELRAGVSPAMSIRLGYERAFATILDSNITTLIAGLALLIFGSGPIRGFAVVHCLGILTSMFSSVLCSRGLVNLWYGRRERLSSISIGQVWRGQVSNALTKNEAEVVKNSEKTPSSSSDQ